MNNLTIKILASIFLLIIGFVSGIFYSKADNKAKNKIIAARVVNTYVGIGLNFKSELEGCTSPIAFLSCT